MTELNRAAIEEALENYDYSHTDNGVTIHASAPCVEQHVLTELREDCNLHVKRIDEVGTAVVDVLMEADA